MLWREFQTRSVSFRLRNVDQIKLRIFSQWTRSVRPHVESRDAGTQGVQACDHVTISSVTLFCDWSCQNFLFRAGCRDMFPPTLTKFPHNFAAFGASPSFTRGKSGNRPPPPARTKSLFITSFAWLVRGDRVTSRFQRGAAHASKQHCRQRLFILPIRYQTGFSTVSQRKIKMQKLVLTSTAYLCFSQLFGKL